MVVKFNSVRLFSRPRGPSRPLLLICLKSFFFFFKENNNKNGCNTFSSVSFLFLSHIIFSEIFFFQRALGDSISHPTPLTRRKNRHKEQKDDPNVIACHGPAPSWRAVITTRIMSTHWGESIKLYQIHNLVSVIHHQMARISTMYCDNIANRQVRP